MTSEDDRRKRSAKAKRQARDERGRFCARAHVQRVNTSSAVEIQSNQATMHDGEDGCIFFSGPNPAARQYLPSDKRSDEIASSARRKKKNSCGTPNKKKQRQLNEGRHKKNKRVDVLGLGGGELDGSDKADARKKITIDLVSSSSDSGNSTFSTKKVFRIKNSRKEKVKDKEKVGRVQKKQV